MNNELINNELREHGERLLKQCVEYIDKCLQLGGPHAHDAARFVSAVCTRPVYPNSGPIAHACDKQAPPVQPAQPAQQQPQRQPQYNHPRQMKKSTRKKIDKAKQAYKKGFGFQTIGEILNCNLWSLCNQYPEVLEEFRAISYNRLPPSIKKLCKHQTTLFPEV